VTSPVCNVEQLLCDVEASAVSESVSESVTSVCAVSCPAIDSESPVPAVLAMLALAVKCLTNASACWLNEKVSVKQFKGRHYMMPSGQAAPLPLLQQTLSG